MDKAMEVVVGEVYKYRGRVAKYLGIVSKKHRFAVVKKGFGTDELKSVTADSFVIDSSVYELRDVETRNLTHHISR